MQTMENNLSKWRAGLTQTRKSTFGKIADFFGVSEIRDDSWDELEFLFIQADIGVKTSVELLESIQARVERDGLIKTEDFNGSS